MVSRKKKKEVVEEVADLESMIGTEEEEATVDSVAEFTEEMASEEAVKFLQDRRIDYFPTGLLTLNLAASNKGRDGGWARGRIINPVGDGSSGKTLLALEGLAHAYYYLPTIDSKIWPKPKKVHAVYNNVEGVMDMPLESMYPAEFLEAVEWIPLGSELRTKPMTVERFGRDLIRRIENLPKGESLVYVADSLDAMQSDAALKRMNESVKKDKELDGSYGTEKAKFLSAAFFNTLCGAMAGKDVTIFMISQIREKLEVANKYSEKYYRAGGKALDFYTHQCPWLYKVKELKGKTRIGGADYEDAYGVRVRAKFKRNKCALPFRQAEFDILLNHGFDNVATMANFFTPDELKKFATHVTGKSIATRREFEELMDTDDGLYSFMEETLEKRWKDIQDNILVKRRDRFARIPRR